MAPRGIFTPDELENVMKHCGENNKFGLVLVLAVGWGFGGDGICFWSLFPFILCPHVGAGEKKTREKGWSDTRKRNICNYICTTCNEWRLGMQGCAQMDFVHLYRPSHRYRPQLTAVKRSVICSKIRRVY